MSSVCWFDVVEKLTHIGGRPHNIHLHPDQNYHNPMMIINMMMKFYFHDDHQHDDEILFS